MVLHWLHMVRHPRYRYMLSCVLSMSDIFTSHCFAPRQLFKRTNSSGVTIPCFSFGGVGTVSASLLFSWNKGHALARRLQLAQAKGWVLEVASCGPAGLFCAVLAFWHCFHAFLRPCHAFLRADIYEGGLQTKERPKQDGRKVAAMILQRRVFGFGYPSKPFS